MSIALAKEKERAKLSLEEFVSCKVVDGATIPEFTKDINFEPHEQLSPSQQEVGRGRASHLSLAAHTQGGLGPRKRKRGA